MLAELIRASIRMEQNTQVVTHLHGLSGVRLSGTWTYPYMGEPASFASLTILTVRVWLLHSDGMRLLPALLVHEGMRNAAIVLMWLPHS